MRGPRKAGRASKSADAGPARGAGPCASEVARRAPRLLRELLLELVLEPLQKGQRILVVVDHVVTKCVQVVSELSGHLGERGMARIGGVRKLPFDLVDRVILHCPADL